MAEKIRREVEGTGHEHRSGPLSAGEDLDRTGRVIVFNVALAGGSSDRLAAMPNLLE